MRRVMGKISDESYKKLEHILPFGSQERIIGLVIEDFIQFCSEDSSRAIKYVARDINFDSIPCVSVTKEDAIDILEILSKSKAVEALQVAEHIRKELKCS